MSGRYLLVFNGLKEGTSAKEAQQVLINQLKLSPQKAQLFLQGKPVFSPVDGEKAKKQQAMFANLGIHVSVKAGSAPTPAQSQPTQQDQVNQQMLAALDYITTTLIRLEEKVDDLVQAQQQLAQPEELMFPEESDPDWGDDLEFDESAAKPKNKLKLVWLVVGIGIVLCVIAGVFIMYPDLLPMDK
jgi:hypothetical protein